MVRLLATLGLLVCCLVLPCASEADTETVDEVSDGEVKGNFKAAENSSWFCPDGWVPSESYSEASCVLLDRTVRNFDSAQTNCLNLGGRLVTFPASDKEASLKALAKTGDGGDYYVGLYKERGYDAGFAWLTTDGRVAANADNLPNQMKTYLSYKAQCTYISSLNDELEIDDCDAEYFSICEKEVTCKPGFFGDKCERECHCAGEPCRSQKGNEGVTCKWGCQRNWMGAACDTEKQDPAVKYFCINSPGEGGKYVHIRIYTKGIQYRAIYGLNVNKTRSPWCSSSTSPSVSPNDLTTINIYVTNDSIGQMSAGRCAGQRLGDNTFSWAIVVRENEGILQEHDLLTNITCDFNKADSLVLSDKYLLDGEPRHVQQVHFTPESTQDDVRLQVINAYTGQQVTEANIGTAVILQIKFGLQKGSLLKGVIPYNCVASSLDGKQVKKLLDSGGCEIRSSPLQPFVSTNESKIVTPWFNLFAFEDEQSVTFQCSFKLCFTPTCSVGCMNSSRHGRDTSDRKEEVEHATARTIRVLPSIPSRRTSGDNNPQYQPGPAPPSSGNEVGPFVYLNPVTCTLFLLILLIFLCMYIAFLRTLRKSVYDIRKEIEVKRSRDKFLHCGCVQQKDRDYVQL